MRTCIKCNQSLDDLEFSLKSKTTGQRSTICKPCHRLYTKQHYKSNKTKYISRAKLRHPNDIARNRKFITDYKKQHSCKFCQESDYRCLDFHHLDQSIKHYNLSRMLHNSITTIQSEIDKCILICSNCHRKLHYPNSDK